MSTVAHLLSDTSITIFMPGQGPVSTTSANPNWDEILDAVADEDWELAAELCAPIKTVTKYFGATKQFKIEDEVLFYKDQPLHNSLADRIVKMAAKNMPVMPLVNFLENMMLNPSSRAVNELYDFLQIGNLPITSDGHFLAYKRVRDDYKDVYSGSVDNRVGSIVSMPRNNVDDDSQRTCSAGLHFASTEYLRHFSGNRLMVLKINPRDVVSIPYDYNNSKGRCCRYQVVDELDPQFVYKNAWEDDVVIDDYEDDSEDFTY